MITSVLLDSVSRDKRRKMRVKAGHNFAVETRIAGDMVTSTGLLTDDIVQAVNASAENVKEYVMSSSMFMDNSNWRRRISL